MELVVRLGADCIGPVGEMPGGPGPISDDTLAEIAAWAPPTASIHAPVSGPTALSTRTS